MRTILAALFPQWRDPRAARDERLCREIVARGICAPTDDLGIAVRACLAHIDSLRSQRDDIAKRWDDVWEARAGMLQERWEVEVERDRAFASLRRMRVAILELVERMR